MATYETRSEWEAAQGAGGASWTNYKVLDFDSATAFTTNYDFLSDGPGSIGDGTHTVAGRAELLTDIALVTAGSPAKLQITSGTGLEADVLGDSAAFTWAAADVFTDFSLSDRIRWIVEASTLSEVNGVRFLASYRNTGGGAKYNVESTWVGGATEWDVKRFDGTTNGIDSSGGSKMLTIGWEKWGDSIKDIQATSGITMTNGPGEYTSWNQHPGSGVNFVASTDKLFMYLAAADGLVIKRIVPQRWE